MNGKTVLVTGASGLLGNYVCKAAAQKGFKVIGTYNSTEFTAKNVIPVKMDLNDEDSISKIFETYKPSWVVHCAALTQVDYCESNRDEAFRLNSSATINLLRECVKLGAVMHYISSMYVFDGENAPYKESYATNPINVYGESKLLPEKEVIKAGGLVIRTSVVFGWNNSNKQNFATWLISNLSEGKETVVFDDMISTPTYAENIASSLVSLYESKCKGIFHVCGADSVSRYGFAEILCQVFGFDNNLLKPKSFRSASQKAMRPANDSADISKIEKLLGAKMSSLHDSLVAMRNEKK